MMLAGIPVPNALVEELAFELRNLGFDDTAETLEAGVDSERNVVALTIVDREAILRALEDCLEDLAELRGGLLVEHEWRVREGVV